MRTGNTVYSLLRQKLVAGKRHLCIRNIRVKRRITCLPNRQYFGPLLPQKNLIGFPGTMTFGDVSAYSIKGICNSRPEQESSFGTDHSSRYFIIPEFIYLGLI